MPCMDALDRHQARLRPPHLRLHFSHIAPDPMPEVVLKPRSEPLQTSPELPVRKDKQASPLSADGQSSRRCAQDIMCGLSVQVHNAKFNIITKKRIQNTMHFSRCVWVSSLCRGHAECLPLAPGSPKPFKSACMNVYYVLCSPCPRESPAQTNVDVGAKLKTQKAVVEATNAIQKQEAPGTALAGATFSTA